jgi:endonuclease/exonuclease/phosphatase family metal-dependent hydrolase
MRLLALATLIPALALGFFACSTDETDPEPEPGPSVVAVSYNGGLARGFVEATDARAPLTTAALAELAADILCVQEFWLPEHVAELQTATQAGLPNTVFLPADVGTVGPAACAPGDTDALETCLTDMGCVDVCPDKLVSCALANCTEFVFGPTGLPTTCLGCVQANVGNPIDDVIATCESETTEFAYGGSFGIGLLSHFTVLGEDTLVMDSTTNRRGVVYAQLDTPLGEIHAFCTHLTAVFSDIEYPKPTGSWEEEQAAQIDELIAWAESKAAGGQIMILGDLNTGPAGTGYVAEVPQNFQRFTDAGFSAPYLETAGAPCTFCADNPIVAGGSDDSTSVVIDHILTKGFGAAGTGARVLDQGITVDNCGETISSAYSDHYGIRVTMQ